jgi:hypothetical protein
MKQKTRLLTLLFLTFVSVQLRAQEKTVNAIDSAQVYYKKKDFQKASYFYDVYYIDQKKSQSNYDTYYAAVAAAHVGKMDRAKYYIQRSGTIGYDFSAYTTFADDPDNLPLRELPEWKKFIQDFKYKTDSAKVATDRLIAHMSDTNIRATATAMNDHPYWQKLASKSSAAQLIQKIKTFNDFSEPKAANFWTLYELKANDTLTVQFLVHIPKGYHPKEKTPLYVYLHGAIIARQNFTKPEYIPNGMEIKAMTSAMEQGALIIYPFGKKTFGWLYQQQAFETILREVAMVKSLYNVDDNKVYVGGHSNGGSGAFWFAVNQPSAFASFFALNYLPKTYFGNTILKNLANERPFYGISGSEDTTFPLATVNSIYEFGVRNGANWTNFVRKGSHTLPFDESGSIDFIFDTLAIQSRNPFPKKINWETDNVKNGRNLWLAITELDTLAARADWHQTLNPEVTQGGKTAEINFNKNKSGAVIATADGNTISLQTSRVKRIKLYISADMFNLGEQIKIIVNGKKYLNFKLNPNKSTILEEFLRQKTEASLCLAQLTSLWINKGRDWPGYASSVLFKKVVISSKSFSKT